MPNSTLEKWEEKTLGEIIHSISNGTSAKQVKNKTDFPVTRIETISNCTINYEKVGYIDSCDNELKDKYLMQEGDILFSNINSDIHLGKTAIYENPQKFLLHGMNLLNIRANREIIIPKFLNYYFIYSRFLGRFIRMASRSVNQSSINQTKLKNFLVCVPSLLEQQRIVGILDEAFENIEKAKQNAFQNLNNAKELYKNIQTSIFNEPFKKKELGEICTLYQGLAINAKTKHLLCDKSSLPLLRIKDLKENCETQFVKEEGFPENALVDENDIIYTRTGSLGLAFKGRKGILHNNSFKVIPNNLIDNDYLFEWLQNPIFNQQIIELAQRAAQPDITHALFKQQIINIPPLEIQLKKVKEIRAIREQTKRLEQIYEQKIKDFDELKQSILQKAFNGEL